MDELPLAKVTKEAPSKKSHFFLRHLPPLVGFGSFLGWKLQQSNVKTFGFTFEETRRVTLQFVQVPIIVQVIHTQLAVL